MSQFDAILKWTDLATAKADPVVQTWYRLADDVFDLSQVVLDAKVWRASQDVGGVHTFLPGYFVWISAPRLILALRNAAALQVVFDRDKINARQAGGVIFSNVSNAILQDLRISPVIMGCNFNWGSLV